MKTDDVLKAIAICACDQRCSGCPYFNTSHKDCVDALLLDSRDLINRQKAEIERLKAENGELRLKMSYMKEPNTIGDIHEMGGVVMNNKYEPCSICERYMNGIACDEHECPVAKMKAEIESLGESVRLQAEMLYDARAEAIKEFAERLKENISNMEYTADVKRKTVPTETLFAQVNWVFHEIVPETIDKLAKEMMEEHRAETD